MKLESFTSVLWGVLGLDSVLGSASVLGSGSVKGSASTLGSFSLLGSGPVTGICLTLETGSILELERFSVVGPVFGMGEVSEPIGSVSGYGKTLLVTAAVRTVFLDTSGTRPFSGGVRAASLIS